MTPLAWTPIVPVWAAALVGVVVLVAPLSLLGLCVHLVRGWRK